MSGDRLSQTAVLAPVGRSIARKDLGQVGEASKPRGSVRPRSA